MKNTAKKIKIGVDFDGVVAYNPFRIIRAPVTGLKRALGMRKVHFYVPKTPIERAIWTVLHESSIFPAKGVDLLRKLAKDDRYELHLVTARYSFLQSHLYSWLDRNDLRSAFDHVHMNVHDQQPHMYKQGKVASLGLDYFIEDNYDIVSHLYGKTKTSVLWIYNITDRWIGYPHKFPYLEKALQKIVESTR